MKIEEFAILAKGMKAVYTEKWFLPDEDSIKIWFNLLKDLEYSVASVAVQKWMMTHREIPTVADIRELCSEVSQERVPSWDEAWEKAHKIIRAYGFYRESEAMAEMDETTRDIIRRIGYKDICMSENIGIERASFRDIYKTMQDRKKQDAQISPKVMNMIQMLQGNNKLIEGE